MLTRLKKTLSITLCLLVSIIVFQSGYNLYSSVIGKIDGHKAINANYFRSEKLPKFDPTKKNVPGLYSPLIHLELPDHNACSAFVIDNNYAITAGHCLSGEPLHNTVQNVNRTLQTALPVRTVGYNMRVDYGLIMGDFSTFNHVDILPNKSFGQELVGTHVVVCGFPEGQTTQLCTPIIIEAPSDFMIVGHGDLFPGMSGGPVIVPGTNLVIGLAEAAAGEPAHLDRVIIAPLTGFLGAMGIE